MYTEPVCGNYLEEKTSHTSSRSFSLIILKLLHHFYHELQVVSGATERAGKVREILCDLRSFTDSLQKQLEETFVCCTYE